MMRTSKRWIKPVAVVVWLAASLVIPALMSRAEVWDGYMFAFGVAMGAVFLWIVRPLPGEAPRCSLTEGPHRKGGVNPITPKPDIKPPPQKVVGVNPLPSHPKPEVIPGLPPKLPPNIEPGPQGPDYAALKAAMIEDGGQDRSQGNMTPPELRSKMQESAAAVVLDRGPSDPNEINIDYVRWLTAERDRINHLDLWEVTFVEGGNVTEVNPEVIEDFILCGLSNIDFITSAEYQRPESKWGKDRAAYFVTGEGGSDNE